MTQEELDAMISFLNRVSYAMTDIEKMWFNNVVPKLSKMVLDKAKTQKDLPAGDENLPG